MDYRFITDCQTYLLQNKTLALHGSYGSGRRTLANQLAARLQTNRFNQELKIKVFKSFRGIPTCSLETLSSTILILPDLIKAWYTDTHIKDIIGFLENLRSDTEITDCFVIATLQYDDWVIMHEKGVSLFQKSFPVITSIEKLREIVGNSGINSPISEEMLKKICSEDTSIGRPLKMALIINNPAFRNDQFYFHPIQFIVTKMKALEKSTDKQDQVKFKALVLTMLRGGEIAKTEIEETWEKVFLDDLIKTEDGKETIKGCIHELINVYIKETKDGKSYKMIHDVITKCTFLAAVENNSDLLFTECCNFPLLECIRHKSNSEKWSFYGKIVYDNEYLQVGVPTEFYPKIAKMFVQRNEIMNMLATVRFFENKKFQKEWYKIPPST